MVNVYTEMSEVGVNECSNVGNVYMVSVYTEMSGVGVQDSGCVG